LARFLVSVQVEVSPLHRDQFSTIRRHYDHILDANISRPLCGLITRDNLAVLVNQDRTTSAQFAQGFIQRPQARLCAFVGVPAVWRQLFYLAFSYAVIAHRSFTFTVNVRSSCLLSEVVIWQTTS
jgi:hypothetical protein